MPAAVLAAHERGGFSVYARNSATGEWTQIAFTLEVDDQGRIIIAIDGLTSLDCFAVTTIAAIFLPALVETAPAPTPTRTPESELLSPPTPVPAAQENPDPQPTPTVESRGIKIPLLVPYAVAEAGEVVESTQTPSEPEKQAAATPEPIAMEAQLGPEINEGGITKIWPILLMVLGAVLLATSLGMFLAAKRRRRF